MELFKRYVAATSMGVVALVCVLVGLLGVTVLRPPTHQVSSVVSSTDLIMTRGNVLSIVKDDVTVTATSKSECTRDAEHRHHAGRQRAGLAMRLHRGHRRGVRPYEAEGRIARCDRPVSRPVAHPGQPGAQSGVQSGAQPLAEPSSADLVQQLASSDMWFKQASGEGTVSLELENVPSGRSALAASAAGPNDLTLTLTWKVEQTNTLAIIAFLAACIFALIALALFLTRWQLLRLRKIREARIEERRKADSLETSSINSAAVAERIAAAREAAPAAFVASEPAKADEPSVEESEQREADADDQHADNAPTWGAAAFASGKNEAEDDEAPIAEADEAVAEDSAKAEPADEAPVEQPAEASDDNAEQAQPTVDTSEEYVPDPLTDTFERRGRHGLDNGPIDQDPPERATTDTGVIDLSGIRGGRTLPSRRALREARNNGEQVVVVDGQEFNTGLIPVTRPRATEQAPAPTSAPDDDASSTGGWTSIMSGWLKDRQEGK